MRKILKILKKYIYFLFALNFYEGFLKKQWSMLGSFIIIKKVIVNITLKAKMLLL
jgi:hypothetical protein